MPRRKQGSPEPDDESEGIAEALRRIEKAKREKSTELNLSGLGLTTVPELLGQLTTLQTLFLYNNQLTTLPESLGQLTPLQTLSLCYNELSTLPESLGRLTAANA